MILQPIKMIKNIIYDYKMLRFVLKQIDPFTQPKWYWTNNKMRLLTLDILRGTSYLNGCNGLNTYKDIPIQWS